MARVTPDLTKLTVAVGKLGDAIAARRVEEARAKIEAMSREALGDKFTYKIVVEKLDGKYVIRAVGPGCHLVSALEFGSSRLGIRPVPIWDSVLGTLR